jgi:hypothetical protein
MRKLLTDIKLFAVHDFPLRLKKPGHPDLM